MAAFAGMWFAVYHLALTLWCDQPRDDLDSPLEKTACYGLAIGLTMAILTAGNGIARLVVPDGLWGYEAVSPLSFALLLLLVLALAVEVIALAKRAAESSHVPPVTPAAADEDVAIGRLCDDFGITAREREVLELYTKGRTATHIASQLFLSESAVKTYLRRAYAKCGVSGRQELLDLLEVLGDGPSAAGSS